MRLLASVRRLLVRLRLLELDVDGLDFRHVVLNRRCRRFGHCCLRVVTAPRLVDEEAIVLENVQASQRILGRKGLPEPGFLGVKNGIRG